MVKLENYSGLTKKQEDLLKKHYCYGSFALLNINLSQSDFVFHTRAAAKHPNTLVPILASSWLQMRNNSLSLKSKLRTDGLTHFIFEMSPKSIIENTKLKAEWKVSQVKGVQNAEPSATLEYSHPSAKAKLTFVENPLQLKGNLTIGKPQYGVGLDGKFDLTSQKLSGYNFALWFFRKHSKVVLKHVGTNADELALGNVELSYYQKLSPLAHFGSKVTTKLAGGETSIEFGGDYKYDENTLLKGKLNTDGKLGLAMSRQLNKAMTFTVGSEIDTKEVAANRFHDYKLGFRLDFYHQ
ncbi:unnamed protein product [Blepharisma stoltei]|uniref:Uncharacterized protein n=1 Tax=Blepharisma stoltei TaxID=1481888 RepID=A0AAU9JC48_9CILI|nr:unnamed protein product [Blepharisma stoltei]